MVCACAARLRLTLATVAVAHGGALEAGREVLRLIARKYRVVTADTLHCNRRTVAAITERGGDYCLALKANQDSLLSDALSRMPEPEVFIATALDLARRDTSKGSLSLKLKRASWNDAFLLSLLIQFATK